MTIHVEDARIAYYSSVTERLLSPYEAGTIVRAIDTQASVGYTSPIYAITPDAYKGGAGRLVFMSLATVTSGTLSGGQIALDASFTQNYSGIWIRLATVNVAGSGNMSVSKNNTVKIRAVPQYVRAVISTGIAGGCISAFFAFSGGR